ncbi:hypothetical protein SCUCBS95973_002942 [Sporothrix curviconia]|uniref:RNase III domain-containing protein n=1 Tax=Sporothrix curviconia TaxID=1260050 RepID=A0ABP0BBB1_9PEZI
MSLTRRALQSSIPAWSAAARPATASFSLTSARRNASNTPSSSSSSTARPGLGDEPLPQAPVEAVPRNADGEVPRWADTPVRMKAPFSLQQPKDVRRSLWRVNTSQARLDRVYEKLLGRELTRALPDELKWLAVTHKSFDNGRRGFNTRLAFFGRMILALESTKAIMASPAVPAHPADVHGRTPFSHPALDNVDKLAAVRPHHFASPERLAALSSEVGLADVVRWKPRMPDNLVGSGQTTVLTSTLFAIIGAVSLHYGADVANRFVRERIVKSLEV